MGNIDVERLVPRFPHDYELTTDRQTDKQRQRLTETDTYRDRDIRRRRDGEIETHRGVDAET